MTDVCKLAALPPPACQHAGLGHMLPLRESKVLAKAICRYADQNTSFDSTGMSNSLPSYLFRQSELPAHLRTFIHMLSHAVCQPDKHFSVLTVLDQSEHLCTLQIQRSLREVVALCWVVEGRFSLGRCIVRHLNLPPGITPCTPTPRTVHTHA